MQEQQDPELLEQEQVLERDLQEVQRLISISPSWISKLLKASRVQFDSEVSFGV